jgi:Rieske Fe-S protein
MDGERHTRRTFFKIAAGIFTASFFGLWGKVTERALKNTSKKVLSIPFSKNKEVIFTDDVLIVNRQGHTDVFSSHCTHLGCVIKSVKNGKLVCPCHGSEFALTGEPLRGPAVKPLEKYEYEIEGSGNRIIVKI